MTGDSSKWFLSLAWARRCSLLWLSPSLVPFVVIYLSMELGVEGKWHSDNEEFNQACVT